MAGDTASPGNTSRLKVLVWVSPVVWLVNRSVLV